MVDFMMQGGIILGAVSDLVVMTRISFNIEIYRLAHSLLCNGSFNIKRNMQLLALFKFQPA